MTAEIAILNRTAVALAADSAATVSGPRGPKTYDSAEKIFELCRDQAIALMVYNNATLLGIPIDVVARKFRDDVSCGERYERLFDLWPRFREYLLTLPREPADEHDFVRLTARYILDSISSALSTFLNKYMVENAFAARRKPPGSPRAKVLEIIERHKASFDRTAMPGFLEDSDFKAFYDRHATVLNGVLAEVYFGEDGAVELQDAFASLMFSVLRSSRRTRAATGLVFAGYGSADLFPKIFSVEVDGIVLGKLRILEGNPIDIDRSGPTSAIVPFAQKEMVERFIFGLDDGFRRMVESIVDGVVQKIVEDKPRSFKGNDGDSVRHSAQNQLRAALDEARLISESRMTGVVDFLSKRELAEMAYSLVELTSRKRRFSSDLDTVGGPIDVAILTRSEGFIWIRRKHFFDKDLNPGYFNRKFRPGESS